MVEHKVENGRYLIRALIETDMPLDYVESGHQESMAVVQNLVSELKKAYGLVLAEKEEHIQQLKSEIETLKHINQFLELRIVNQGRSEDQSEISY
jgi:hypothetical protein